MASRVNNLLSHIAIRDSDSDEMRYVKQRLALASLASQFTMSQEKMKQITMYMIHEMVEGLEGRESTIRMLPSYVYTSNPNKATGVYYALDLGGTNFRVLRVSLRHGKVDARIDSKFVIPKAALTGTATDLFDFIAQSVKKMMLENAPEDMENRVPLGFTFSFACDQKAVNKGLLIKWTKGFSTKGVEGQDVVELLQTSLRRVKINVNVVALCNDTVGTLVARYFVDTDVQVGAIIGTGCNACYFERASAVTKDSAVAAHGNAVTPINMECGGFDSKYKFVLPITQYDDELDQITPNKGSCQWEKMVSGMYLGEVARRIIVHLAKIGCLPRELQAGLTKAWSFESKHLGMIAADQMPGLQFTRLLLQKISGVDVTDVSDLHTVREACCLVRSRSAEQSAIFSAAPMLKTHTQGLGTIAVDGSVYEKMPSFQRLYQENISRLLGKMSNAKAVLQKDGSGIGAAMICALAAAAAK
ncbi:putative hexokinase [Leptomonas pyrrhocoris]|uniref:Phosphotransferase n=1 Tax=Leptomonas pyrrhocoris TaxID=157538 RepID=A0A0N0DTY9_LEPPY|nr:putative hexokinase [Leptomonas pyrrhocoris]KPA78134.1 putative hexokinase [Leptomonas pyrrhocoris]|eukprot:XP_015656573.1 putative hexokinase [Leptomonas pyrrhocoris]